MNGKFMENWGIVSFVATMVDLSSSTSINQKYLINILVACLCICQTFNIVFLKKVSITAPHASYIIAQGQAFCSLVAFGALTIYRHSLSSISISKHFALRFAFIALCYTFNNLLILGGSSGDEVPGALLVILLQLPVITSMLISYFGLKKRFNSIQIVAAICLLLGIFLAVFPTFKIEKVKNAGSVLLIVLATIGMAVAGVFIEYILEEQPFDRIWGLFWINVFQFIFGLFCVFTQPLVDRRVHNDFGHAFKALNCLVLGKNSYPDDQCKLSGVWFWGFIVFNIPFNTLQVELTHADSASLMFIGAAASIPFAQVLFSWNILFPDSFTPLTWHIALSMFIVVTSLYCYRRFSTDELKNIPPFGVENPSDSVPLLFETPYHESTPPPKNIVENQFLQSIVN